MDALGRSIIGRATVLVALLACGALWSTSRLHAQADSTATIGLALSGGGAKGFAHIGLLKVLEAEGIPVHVITGTSMGGIVGGLYASGFTIGMVTAMATQSDWTAVFLGESDRGSLPIERRIIEQRTAVSFPIRGGSIGLPTSLVSGQGITERLDELTWGSRGDRDFTRFPIAFTAVATDLETGEAVALHSGSLAEALRASSALPSVLEPVELDGRLLIDGGLARNLPAEDARRLGTDLLICSDVTDDLAEMSELQTMAEVFMQTISFTMIKSNIEQRRLCDVLIRPDMGELDAGSFDQAVELIDMGEAAARAVLPEIRTLLQANPPRPAVDRPLAGFRESIIVDRVELVGFELTPEAWVRRLIGIDAGDRVVAGDMRRAVRRAYATGLFTRVAYRLTPVDLMPNRYVVTIVATEESRDRFGLGLRYESNQKASLLFDLTLHNKLRYGSTTRLEARLGEQLSMSGSFLSTAHSGTDLTFGVTGNVTRAPLDLFDEDRRIARIDSKTEDITTFVGLRLGSLALAGATVTVGRSHPGAEVAAADSVIPSGEAYATVGVTTAIDRMDEAVFPRKGVNVVLVAEAAVAGGTFSRAYGRMRVAVPVTRSVSLLARAVGGSAGGVDLPPHYRFYAGGDFEYSVYPYAQHALYGFAPQQLSGRDLRLLDIGIQVEVRPDWYAGGHWNAADVGDDLTWPGSFGDLETGWALTLGTRSPIGPLTASITWRADDNSPALSIDLGRRF